MGILDHFSIIALINHVVVPLFGTGPQARCSPKKGLYRIELAGRCVDPESQSSILPRGGGVHKWRNRDASAGNIDNQSPSRSEREVGIVNLSISSAMLNDEYANATHNSNVSRFGCFIKLGVCLQVPCIGMPTCRFKTSLGRKVCANLIGIRQRRQAMSGNTTLVSALPQRFSGIHSQCQLSTIITTCLRSDG